MTSTRIATRLMTASGAALLGFLVMLPAATGAPKNQFATESEAKASCPGDAVVWANHGSKIYHPTTSRSYGKTKSGSYMCEKEAAGEGFRAPKPRRSGEA
jgi:hypothetical protein